MDKFSVGDLAILKTCTFGKIVGDGYYDVGTECVIESPLGSYVRDDGKGGGERLLGHVIRIDHAEDTHVARPSELFKLDAHDKAGNWKGCVWNPHTKKSGQGA